MSIYVQGPEIKERNTADPQQKHAEEEKEYKLCSKYEWVGSENI